MIRSIIQITKGVQASGGAGVKLTRILASPELDMVDAFLRLDRFESETPNYYIGGFPPRFLLLAGKRLEKPVVRCGPFVMNICADRFV